MPDRASNDWTLIEKMRSKSPHPYVITPQAANNLRNQLEDDTLVFVDLSRMPVFYQMHIPDAHHLEAAMLQGITPPPDYSISQERLSIFHQRLNITENAFLILYDDEGGGWAGRCAWTLDCLGHKHYAYLDGGIQAWSENGLPLIHGDQAPHPEITPAITQFNDTPLANKSYILDHLKDPSVVLLDARSPEEFKGEKTFAQRGGHIPGAINYEWTLAMQDGVGTPLRDLAEIEKDLVAKGITKDKTIVTYCQSHHRSAFMYLVLKILNYPNIKGYPGSWGEWGNLPDTPIET